MITWKYSVLCYYYTTTLEQKLNIILFHARFKYSYPRHSTKYLKKTRYIKMFCKRDVNYKLTPIFYTLSSVRDEPPLHQYFFVRFVYTTHSPPSPPNKKSNVCPENRITRTNVHWKFNEHATDHPYIWTSGREGGTHVRHWIIHYLQYPIYTFTGGGMKIYIHM